MESMDMQQNYETEENFITKKWKQCYNESKLSPSIVTTVLIVFLVSALLYFMERYRGSGKREQIKRGKQYVVSIMKNYEDISGGMKLLRSVFDLETAGDIDVVLRAITEDYWINVIGAAEESHVCALGTPGIGKTTTTCILIRLLLLQKKKVVYHMRTSEKEGWIYIFTPSNDTETIDVAVKKENLFTFSSIDDHSTYYIVDPGRTKDNCNPPIDFQGKVIIVASPDEGHWGGSDFIKIRRKEESMGDFRIFPVWELNELIIAGPYIESGISKETIESRYDEVGGVPRHIFIKKKSKYLRILNEQKSAINRLTAEQVDNIFIENWKSIDTLSSTQPKSSLMVYGDSGNEFITSNVGPSSRYVIRQILKRFSKHLWNKILDLGTGGGGLGWKAFESYCQNLMVETTPVAFVNCKYYNKLGVLVNRSNDDKPLKFGGCKKICGTSKSVVTAAIQEQKILYYALDSAHPLIDFAYLDGTIVHGFQVTLGETHSCNKKYIIKFVEEARSNNFTFQMHYLVYDKNFENFKISMSKANMKKLINDIQETPINVVSIHSPFEDQTT